MYYYNPPIVHRTPYNLCSRPHITRHENINSFRGTLELFYMHCVCLIQIFGVHPSLSLIVEHKTHIYCLYNTWTFCETEIDCWKSSSVFWTSSWWILTLILTWRTCETSSCSHIFSCCDCGCGTEMSCCCYWS